MRDIENRVEQKKAKKNSNSKKGGMKKFHLFFCLNNGRWELFRENGGYIFWEYKLSIRKNDVIQNVCFAVYLKDKKSGTDIFFVESVNSDVKCMIL